MSSNLQRRLIIDATRAPLVRFPRGWAVDKSGPFYPSISIRLARQKGFIRPIPGGRKGKKFTARSHE